MRERDREKEKYLEGEGERDIKSEKLMKVYLGDSNRQPQSSRKKLE